MSGARSSRSKARGVSITIDVRWGDMDAFNHVNNTLYFRYFESARIAYLEAMGVTLDRSTGRTGPGLVAANTNFKKQVRYPATLTATANVTAVSERSITFTHLLRDAADGTVMADGGAVCVWMDYHKEKALQIPDALLRAIARIEQNPALARRSNSRRRIDTEQIRRK